MRLTAYWKNREKVTNLKNTFVTSVTSFVTLPLLAAFWLFLEQHAHCCLAGGWIAPCWQWQWHSAYLQTGELLRWLLLKIEKNSANS